MKQLARVLLGSVLMLAGGCHQDAPAHSPLPSEELRIGLGGLGAETEEAGLRQIARNQSIEPLVKYDESGRPHPALAERWTLSSDGRTLSVHLKPVQFHDGTALRASDVIQRLERSLPQTFGPLFDEIAEMRAESDTEFVIAFKHPTAFAVDALDVQITKPDNPAIGTGPYMPAPGSSGNTELVANPRYHAGRPALTRILLKPYPTARAAWADLLRGQVDVLYEVGIDALDSLEPSSQVKLYNFRRHYQLAAIFNLRRPALRDKGLRRLLNEALDRNHLVAEALGGLGRPALGPVWPEHWAYDANASRFQYVPRPVTTGPHLKLVCIFPSAVNERLALTVQRQLQSVGVDLELQSLPLDEVARRMSTRDFDLLLTEPISGPNLVRPYLFWHSQGPYNYGGFESPEVDAALEQIRDAKDDDAYRRAVTSFQNAITADPPALFLAWSERARAVSTAFEVRSEPNRDILNDLYLWRPAGGPTSARVN